MRRRNKQRLQERWDELVQKATSLIPTVECILEQALRTLQLDANFVNSQLGRALRLVDEQATEIYLANERKALEFAAQNWLEQNRDHLAQELSELLSLLREQGWDAFKQRVMPIFVDFAELVQKLEKHLGNMRKARGGQTFELAVVSLLGMIGINCEKPRGSSQQELKRIDLVVPDVQTALVEPTRTVFLTLKRTLRERWKQEVPAAQGRRCWLLTLDTNLSADKADEIKQLGLEAVYCLSDVASKLQREGKTWVRSLDNLPDDLRQVLEVQS